MKKLLISIAAGLCLLAATGCSKNKDNDSSRTESRAETTTTSLTIASQERTETTTTVTTSATTGLYIKSDDKNVISAGIYGKDGDNIKWVLSKDGTLTFSGKGEMMDVAELNIPNQWMPPWYIYRHAVKKAVIPEGITNISNNTFSGCASLTEVTMPSSIKSIGENAFSGCASLIGLQIPKGVTDIGSWAFFKCKSLKSITLPDAVTQIGDYAFYGCEELEQITIPKSTKVIGKYALWVFKGDADDTKKSHEFTIFCYPDSAGLRYAVDNNFDYKLIE